MILLVGGLVAAKQTGMIGQPKATEVDFASVKRINITERVSASGRVQPQVEVKISPDVSGEIIGLYVNEGDPVKAGQLLCRIRPDNYESLLARAQATVNQSRAQLEQSKASVAQSAARLIRAKADYERNRKLFADKVVSAADLETSEANYNVAKQEVEAADANVRASKFNIQSSEASLRDANDNLRKTTIYCPVNGTVSKLNIELGERVVGTSQMAGTEIMRIANLQNMEVRVNVNENDHITILGETPCRRPTNSFGGAGDRNDRSLTFHIHLPLARRYLSFALRSTYMSSCCDVNTPPLCIASHVIDYVICLLVVSR